MVQKNRISSQALAKTLAKLILATTINQRNLTFLICLKIIDFAIVYYHLIIGIVQYSFYSKDQREKWFFEQLLLDLSQSNFLYINIGIFILYLSIFTGMVYLMIRTQHEGKKKYAFQQIAGALSIILSLIQHVFGLPFLNIILRSIITTIDNTSGALFGGLVTLASLNLTFFAIIHLFLSRIILLHTIDKSISLLGQPCGGKIQMLLMVNKIGIVTLQVVTATQSFARDHNLAMVLSLLVINFLACIFSLILQPLANPILDRLVKVSHQLYLACTLVFTLAILFEHKSTINFGYILIFSICIVCSCFLIEEIIKNGNMNESQPHNNGKIFSKVIYQLTQMEELLYKSKTKSSLKCIEVVKLFAMIRHHQEECLEYGCPCQQVDGITWLIHLGIEQNSLIISLTQEEINQVNSYSDIPIFHLDLELNAPFTFNLAENKSDIQKALGSNSQQSSDIQVDLSIMLQLYFSSFIETKFLFALKRFRKEDVALKIMYASFVLYQQMNCIKCMNILKTLSDHKQSFMSKLNTLVNEQILLDIIKNNSAQRNSYEISRMGRVRQIREQNRRDGMLGTIDYKKMIGYSKLQEGFQRTVLSLSEDIYSFWQDLSSNKSSVPDLLTLQIKFANNYAESYRMFREIEENYDKRMNEKAFYLYAILHKELMNDKSTYSLYIEKYRQILSMNKLLYIGNNDPKQFSLQGGKEEVGILVVSAFIKNFGEILEINNTLKTMTGYTEANDLKNGKYEVLLNHLIKQWHPHFVKEFETNGQSDKLNRKTINNFILCKDGFVKPVQLLLRLEYHDQYGYSFIAIFNPLNQIHMGIAGEGGHLVKTKDLLIFLCDSQTTKIHDMNQKASEYLKLQKEHLREGQSYFDHDLIITDIIPDLKLQQENQNQITCEERFITGVCHIDLQFQKNLQQFTQTQQDYQYIRSQLVPFNFTVYRETYASKSDYSMSIIVLQVQEQQQQNQTRSIKKNEISQQIQNDNQYHEEDISSHNIDSQSSCSSGMSSKIEDLIRNQNVQMAKRIPRSLKLVMQLIFLMFLTMVAISIMNLYLSQTRLQQVTEAINVVKQSFQKIQHATRSRMSMRLLINIANGFESQNSSVIPNKLSYIQSQIIQTANGLLKIQQFLDTSEFEYSDFFNSYRKTAYIPIEFLDQNAYSFSQNHTMTNMINMMSTKLIEAYNMNLAQVKGRLEQQTIYPTPKPFKPTDNENTIYFLSQNGNNAMRFYNFGQATQYTSDLKSFSEKSILFMLITLSISIVTIVFVFIVITPIQVLISHRQYKVLSFFVKMPSDKSLIELNKAKEFIENQIGSKDQNSLLKKNGQNVDENQDIRSLSSSSQYYSSLVQASNPSVLMHQNSFNLAMNQTEYDYLDISNTSMLKSPIKESKSPLEDLTQQQYNKNDQQNPTFFMSFGTHSHKDINKKQKDQLEDCPSTLSQVSDVRLIRQINKEKSWMKVKIVVGNFLCMSLFSIYFIGNYLLSQGTYGVIPTVIDSLNVVYFKDVCIENAMIYTRENQMRNYSVRFPENGKTASTVFINRCMDYEKQYLQIRKAKHPAFAQAQEFMDYIEQEQGVCAVSFPDSQVERDNCLKAQNGLLKQGLSGTISYMIQHFTKEDLKFTDSTRVRDLTTLLEMNTNPATSSIIEVKVYLMDPLFYKMKDVFTQATTVYFNGQIASITIIFSCFIAMLLVAFSITFFYAFYKIKNYLWLLNLTLKILPIDELKDDKLQEEIKKYFQQ